MNDISWKLLVAKKKSRLSYSDLEKLTGFPASTLQRCVNGETKKIPFDIIAALCRVLDVDIGELRGQAPEDLDDDTWALRERIRRDPEVRTLFSAINKATPEHIRTVTAVLKTLQPDAFPPDDPQEFPDEEP